MNSRNFSITETVAVIGVIASLLFVGYEIRQGNEVARNDALSATSAMWLQTTMEIAGSERISRIMTRSITESRSDFNATDAMAFFNITLGLVKMQEITFRQLELGITESADVTWPPADNPLYTSKMQHELWPQLRKWFSDDFAVVWEQRYGYID